MEFKDKISSLLNNLIFFVLVFGIITLIVSIGSENYQTVLSQPAIEEDSEIPQAPPDDQSPLDSSQADIPVDDPDKKRLEKLKLENPDGVSSDDSPLPPNSNSGDDTDISKPITLTDINFDDVSSKYPILVMNFWAEWCGPCKSLSPKINELATELSGKAVFGKLNIDEYPVVANDYGIQNIPTLIIFENGEVVDSLNGAMSKEQIKAAISLYL